jgi:hypothetical protein
MKLIIHHFGYILIIIGICSARKIICCGTALIEDIFPEILAYTIEEGLEAACEEKLPAVDLFEHYHKAILEDILCILGGASHPGNDKAHHGNIPVPQVTNNIALTVTQAFDDLHCRCTLSQ